MNSFFDLRETQERSMVNAIHPMFDDRLLLTFMNDYELSAHESTT